MGRKVPSEPGIKRQIFTTSGGDEILRAARFPSRIGVDSAEVAPAVAKDD